MNNWDRGKLSQIAEIIMGQSPPGEACNNSGLGIPLLNGPTEFGAHHPKAVQYTTDARKKSKIGDILFCVRGSTTGRMNYSDQNYAIGRGLAAIRHKSGIEYQTFVKAVIEYHLPILLGSSTGSTFPNVSQDQLRNLDIHIPPLETQKEIAHILGTLDDKMELNRRMNKTLELIAQALFKHWFIDFEFPNAAGKPYKSSGGALIDSELGPIPYGWKVGKVKDCCVTIQNGGTPVTKTKEYWEPSEIPWLTSGEVRQNIITQTLNSISNEGLKNSSAKWTPKDSTVVALYGATAGQIALSAISLTTNQAICGLIPKENYRYYNYMTLLIKQNELINQARGSAQQNISKEIVESLSVILPENQVLESFDNCVSSIYSKTLQIFIENAELIRLFCGNIEFLMSAFRNKS